MYSQIVKGNMKWCIHKLVCGCKPDIEGKNADKKYEGLNQWPNKCK